MICQPRVLLKHKVKEQVIVAFSNFASDVHVDGPKKHWETWYIMMLISAFFGNFPYTRYSRRQPTASALLVSLYMHALYRTENKP